MKILVIHNRYLFAGGEDRVVESEIELLKSKGHDVMQYTRSNEELYSISRRKQVQAVMDGFTRSGETYRDLVRIIKEQSPDVAHFHNPFFLMTPSAYEACFDQHIPVVQTLHNYRFLCPSGVLFNCGKVCEKCLSGGLYPAVLNRCVHHSLIESLIAVGMLLPYRRRKILKNISAFISPSEFCKNMYCSHGGLNPDKVFVKPHFVQDPGHDAQEPGKYALYVGTIRDYKGVGVLLQAWQSIPSFPLKLVGSIPPESAHFNATKQENVEFVGEMSYQETISMMRKAAFVVVPSLCYETFNRVIIEAYALGKPVVVSNIGALGERVVDGETGFLFEAGDVKGLVEKVTTLIESIETAKKMGNESRKLYEQYYTVEQNGDQMMAVYDQAITNECNF